MKHQLFRFYHTKKAIGLLFILISIPMIEIIQLFHLQLISDVTYHPAFAFFLSGMSRGHASQIILLWFLPIYFLIMFSDESIQDYETGTRMILISRMGLKKYVKEKLFASFFASSMIMGILLAINFICVHLLFFRGDYKNGLDEMVFSDNWLFTISMAHHYIGVAIFSFFAISMAGFAGLLGASMSLFFKNRKYTYTATFFIWFAFLLRKDSLMFVFQPFTEYGLDVIAPIYLIASLLILVLAIGVYWNERDRNS